MRDELILGAKILGAIIGIGLVAIGIGYKLAQMNRIGGDDHDFGTKQ